MNLMETKDLQVGYDKKPLIDHISLSVENGKILTLIGPNGSGKSTILKTVIRQLKSLSGVIFLDGKNQDQMNGNEIAKSISMVMTERIHPELMTCRDMVETGRYPYTGHMGILSQEDQKKVTEAMEVLKITDLQDRSFQAISDGQKQRVMLARALCQDTKVLVMDEPTSFLDVHYKLEILERIREIAIQKNMAILMSLHELDLALKISDTIACVDGKEVVKVGTPEEVLKDDFLQKLYDVPKDRFHPMTGNLFLQKKEGAPRIFVISGGGKGLSLYNRLQREQVAFAAGILSPNDVEYEAAKAYAAEVVETKAFYPIETEQVNRAKQLIDSCESCICTLQEFGPLNRENEVLMLYAKKAGKLK